MIVAIPLLATAFFLQIPDMSREVDESRCGGYALFIALRSLDLGPRSIDLLLRDMGEPGPGGFKLTDLERHATLSGAKTLMVKTTIENLARRKRPFACITRIREDHWVVLADLTESAAVIIDYPQKYEIPLAAFRRIWFPESLIVSSLPLEEEESLNRPSIPAIVFGLGLCGLLALLFGLLRRRATKRIDVDSQQRTGLLLAAVLSLSLLEADGIPTGSLR